MIIDFNTGKKTERIDGNGQPITDSRVLAEIERLENIPKESRKAKENIRLRGLLKNGNQAKNKNILTREANKHKSGRKPNADGVTLAELNQEKPNKDKTPILETVKAIIDSVYNGINPIKAIKDSPLTPRQFYNILDGEIKGLQKLFTCDELEEIKQKKINFEELKKDFSRARGIFAEFCLFKREELESQLLAGEIDCSTYSTLSNDYKYLAGKFAPAIYGDKISIDTTTTHNVNHSINAEQVKSLNALLNKGLEPIEAEFEEVPQIENKSE